MLTKVQPSVDLTYTARHAFLSAGYRGSLQRFASLEAYDSYDQGGHAEYRQQFSRRLALSVRDNFSISPTTDLVEVAGVPFSNAAYNQYYKQAINKRKDTLVGLSFATAFTDALSLRTTAYYEDKDGYGVSPEAYQTSLTSYNNERNRIWHYGGKQFKTGRDMTCYLGSPDIDYAKSSEAFGVEAEVVKEPGKLKDAIARAQRVIADGRPYLLDIHTYRDGLGAVSTWHPPYSIADLRSRKV